jgi:hemerythrin
MSMVRETRWDPKKHSVGFDIIDNQHEVLFDLIKDLKTSFASKINMRVQDTLHGVLHNYAFEHFHIEEECIKNHPDYNRHCLEHYRMIYRLQKFIVDFRNIRNDDKLETLGFFENWLQEHIEQYDRPFFDHDTVNLSTVNLSTVNLNTVNLTLMTESDKIEDFDLELLERRKSERRKHKRIGRKDVVDEEIRVRWHNVTRKTNGQATIVNISTGGLMLMASSESHGIDDLLIVTCAIGSNFKMKENVRVRRAIGKIYGVEFVSLSLKAMNFITGLYGAIHMSGKPRLP